MLLYHSLLSWPKRQPMLVVNWGRVAGASAVWLVALNLPRLIFSEIFVMYVMPLAGACMLLVVSFGYVS